MRLASESVNFPYTSSTVCYLEVDGRGQVTSPPGDGVSARVREKTTRLYAVWPGQYRSDLFLIDDIDEYEKALGIQHDPVRTGLQDHRHEIDWRVSPYEDNPTASYISVDATLSCGCEIRDLRVFAKHLQAQRGWQVAVTGGWSGGRPKPDGTRTYTLRVRRNSLD